jgi:hypothetical protein
MHFKLFDLKISSNLSSDGCEIYLFKFKNAHITCKIIRLNGNIKSFINFSNFSNQFCITWKYIQHTSKI